MNHLPKYNYVFFFSEGPPYDKGLALGDCKDKLIEAATPYVDNISYYTPKILEDMGYGEYVKNYEDKGLCTRNPGMNHIGFEAWKPLILLLELEKMEHGDILIIRDANCKKNKCFLNFKNIKNDVKECLDIYNFDFCIPSQNNGYLAHPYIKTNVIKELGEDHPMMWQILLLSCHQFFMRKSNCVLELLEEWRVASLKEEWRNGKVYGKLHEGFKWSTNAQAILCCIITNWIRKRKYNIPLNYMKLYFPYGDLKQRKINTNFSYLKYLNPLLESNGKIKGIYINLDRDKDKRKLMEDKLNKLDFCNYRRFNAIIGSEVYNKLLQEDKIYKINDTRGIYVNNFMVGCWQSHLHIWQEMIDKNISVQLIMEDDCVFHEKFNEKIYKVLDMIKDTEFDILYIGYCGDSPIFNKELYLLTKGRPRTTHSYILTLSGAKKLVEKMSRLNWPIDEIMGGLMANKNINGYKTSELLVWQPWQWDRSLDVRQKYFKPRCAILITGQLRTFDKCFKNWQDNILSNYYIFDIYIFTDFYNTPGYKNMYNVNNIEEFKEKIYNVYGNSLKKLYIESENNTIHFPEYINVNKDPRKRNQYKCQYRNYLITKFLQNDNIKLHDYNIIIRSRPDIEFTKKIELDKYYNKNELYIVTRVNSGGNNIWIHNRDWDYCCIGNYSSIINWIQEWKIIKKLYEETNFNNRLFDNFEYKVIKKCDFNNQGYWEESTKEVNKAIGQLYLNYLSSVSQNVIFDLPCETYAKIVRF